MPEFGLAPPLPVCHRPVRRGLGFGRVRPVNTPCGSCSCARNSDMLPRMDLLRKAELRPLDTFEASGVVRLRQGQTLVVSEEGLFRLRLLGAIRATAGCVDCHGCERGELLGAFSYVLRRQ